MYYVNHSYSWSDPTASFIKIHLELSEFMHIDKETDRQTQTRTHANKHVPKHIIPYTEVDWDNSSFLNIKFTFLIKKSYFTNWIIKQIQACKVINNINTGKDYTGKVATCRPGWQWSVGKPAAWSSCTADHLADTASPSGQSPSDRRAGSWSRWRLDGYEARPPHQTGTRRPPRPGTR